MTEQKIEEIVEQDQKNNFKDWIDIDDLTEDERKSMFAVISLETLSEYFTGDRSWIQLNEKRGLICGSREGIGYQPYWIAKVKTGDE